jgi:hypothetical protein
LDPRSYIKDCLFKIKAKTHVYDDQCWSNQVGAALFLRSVMFRGARQSLKKILLISSCSAAAAAAAAAVACVVVFEKISSLCAS